MRAMDCHYHAAGRCRSCAFIGTGYARQLADKEAACRALLVDWPDLEWLPPVASAPSGFRNKAKMAIGGSVDAPTLGILDAGFEGVDLRACPLYPAAITQALPRVAELLVRARVVPYQVLARRGEGKFVLLTASPDGELMLRVVLRSTEAVERLRKQLPWLQAALPGLRVFSANIQPAPAAVLEGEREILFGPDESLRMDINGLPLQLRPQGFFQTNTGVAAALYRQVREWVDAVAPASLWDLYCGVGGFALHCAAPDRCITGVEGSPEAVASAERTRDALGLPARGKGGVRFIAADATAFAAACGDWPAAVIVNPPRRGIGERLARLVDASDARWLVYSSCNAASLARDLAAMPRLRPRSARLLDMFPQTGHYELAMLLERT